MAFERSNPPGVHQPAPTYTHLIRVKDGDLLYISGQIALDEAGELVGKGDLGAQARQVFKNLKAILASVGADLSNVLKWTIYIVNYQHADREILVGAMQDEFDAPLPPASTLLGVQSLAYPDLLIEIDAIGLVESS
jgi:enamine deaminase RidA (YjgF/YER057c/UK114 family)